MAITVAIRAGLFRGSWYRFEFYAQVGPHLVWAAKQAPLESAEMDIWPGVELPISNDGDQRMAGMAGSGLVGCQVPSDSVWNSTVAERNVVRGLLWQAHDRRRVWRNPSAVDHSHRNHGRVLSLFFAGGMATDPVCGLGRFRILSKFSHLANELKRNLLAQRLAEINPQANHGRQQ